MSDERHNTPAKRREIDEQARHVAPPKLTDEGMREVDRQARLLLGHETFGPLLRVACNAGASSRRQRVHALYVWTRIALLYPALQPFICRAVGLAWAERLGELVPSHVADETVRDVRELMDGVVVEVRKEFER